MTEIFAPQKWHAQAGKGEYARRIKTKRQKEPGEMFKEISRSRIQERINMWPITMLNRWRWWCGVIMVGVSHLARNCAYLTVQYKCAKYLLHIRLYRTTALTSQSQAYATSIPKSKSMGYSQSIYHVCIVCELVSKCNICKIVPTPEIHLQIYGTPMCGLIKFQILRTWT